MSKDKDKSEWALYTYMYAIPNFYYAISVKNTFKTIFVTLKIGYKGRKY